MAGKKIGKNPTDRAKIGVKRSLLTDAKGIPLSVAIDGANRHDMKLARPTLENIKIRKPKPTKKKKQNLCLDKGYDFDEIRELAKEFGFTAHIRSRGEEAKQIKEFARKKARRWLLKGHTVG
ncbi:MAG: transposase [Candidatus Aenigmarchaeota archaeon]|nr:transposase [Candidatus Aenigmarchaeota archaeon]